LSSVSTWCAGPEIGVGAQTPQARVYGVWLWFQGSGVCDGYHQTTKVGGWCVCQGIKYASIHTLDALFYPARHGAQMQLRPPAACRRHCFCRRFRGDPQSSGRPAPVSNATRHISPMSITVGAHISSPPSKPGHAHQLPPPLNRSLSQDSTASLNRAMSQHTISTDPLYHRVATQHAHVRTCERASERAYCVTHIYTPTRARTSSRKLSLPNTP